MSVNRQTEIALAAVRLFEQKGYRATSVQDIADAVGLQKGSLYHYIHSKEELLLQIAKQAIGEFNHTLEQILEEDIPARDKLSLMIENHLVVSVTNLQTTTVLLREAFALDEPQHQMILDQTDKYVDLVATILEEGREQGEFDVEDTKITALAILGSCNWLYRWYQTSGKLTAREVARMFSHVFLHGLLAKPKGEGESI
jgi:AcrR family transcriptional regulator